MKQQNLAEVSKRSGKSPSTVSKVLRGCPGVDAVTRETVMRSYRELSGSEAIGQETTDGGLWVFLPDNPKYFWSNTRRVLAETDGRISPKLKIFSRIDNEKSDLILSEYIEEAVGENARALIIAAHPGEALCRRLTELAKDRLILQLCEYTPLPNTFYVGSDPYQDGRALAEAVLRSDRHPRIGVLRADSFPTCADRIRGFAEGLGAGAELFYADAPDGDDLYAARLARSIDALGVPLDYVFCPDGLTTAACDALYKLRARMSARLIGFEYPPTAEKHRKAGRIAALALQDPAAQTRAAVALAAQYLLTRQFPDRKFTTLPSEILI